MGKPGGKGRQARTTSGRERFSTQKTTMPLREEGRKKGDERALGDEERSTFDNSSKRKGIFLEKKIKTRGQGKGGERGDGDAHPTRPKKKKPSLLGKEGKLLLMCKRSTKKRGKAASMWM